MKAAPKSLTELRAAAHLAARVTAAKDQRVPAVWKRYGG